MKKTFLTLTAIGFCTAVFAQSELSGDWQRQDVQSISGKLYGNGTPEKVKVTVDGKALIFDKIHMNGDQAQAIKETVTIDGKAFETVTSSKRKKVITLSKDGAKYIELASQFDAADVKKLVKKTTDTWTIENGQLVLDRKDENLENGEVWETKATYTKKQ